MNQTEAIDQMISAGRRLDTLGYVPATDGNLSVRVSPREIVATISGVKKGFLKTADFAVIDPEGRPLRGGAPVSSEIRMHLRVYRDRPDVMAVVHAHPPTATGFAVAGLPLHQCVLPEVVATIGAVPLAPYATPSTEEVAEALAPYLKQHDAVLLSNHGVVTFGPTLFQATNRMETVEQFAKILFVARTLGHVNLLTPEQVEQLNQIRHRYGFEGRAAECQACRDCRPFTDVDLLLARVSTGTPQSMASPSTPVPPPAPLLPGASAAPAASAAGAPEAAAGHGSLMSGSLPDALVDRVVREVLRTLQQQAK